MKRLKKLLFMFAVCFSLLSVIPMTGMTVYASEESSANVSDEEVEVFDTGNAISDIMTDGRFKGAISSISKITEFVDIWFVRIISLVSFFIISAALLKNACAGAYCANSKFWDKVADAHQKTEAINLAGVKNFFAGGQGLMNTSAGGIRDFFLGIIPNIKAFTDFDDADIEPKAYFMKAIPQMIACVVIGIFIYNGYYRDTAATVGEMGSVIIERTLGSVNPDSFINKIFNTTGWPKSPWDKDKSREGEWKQAVFKELKGIVASNYSDITSAQQKAEAVTAIVNMIQTQCGSDFQTYAAQGGAGDGYIYKMSGMSSYASAATSGFETGIVEDGTGNMRGAYMFDMNAVGASVARNSANNTAYVTFTLKKVADDGQQGSSSVDADGFGVTGSGERKLELKTNIAFMPVGAGVKVESGKLVLTEPLLVPTAEYTDTPIGYLGQGANTSCKIIKRDNANYIQIREGTYTLDDQGRFEIGPLAFSSNKSSGTSETVYVGFR